MINKNSTNRIIYIDLLRLFALTMMIVGHSIDVLLNYELKLPNSVIFGSYSFFRGITAPLFLFSSGFIYGFRFSLNSNTEKFDKILKQTYRRGIFLMVIGYLSKSPTTSPFYLSHINNNMLMMFLAFDILQLIGFSLIIIALINHIWKIKNFNLNRIIIILITLIIILTPLISKINWENILPLFFSSFFSTKTGSLFPIFPWMSYILIGMLLGLYIQKRNIANDEVQVSEIFTILTVIFCFVALLNDYLEILITGQSTFWFTSPNYIFLRLSAVYLLTSIFALLSFYIKRIPQFLLNLSKNSLWIYIFHIAILYGTAWNKGIKESYNSSLSIPETALGILLIFIVVIIFSEVWTYSKKKIYKIDLKKLLSYFNKKDKN